MKKSDAVMSPSTLLNERLKAIETMIDELENDAREPLTDEDLRSIDRASGQAARVCARQYLLQGSAVQAEAVLKLQASWYQELFWANRTAAARKEELFWANRTAAARKDGNANTQ